MKNIPDENGGSRSVDHLVRLFHDSDRVWRIAVGFQPNNQAMRPETAKCQCVVRSQRAKDIENLRITIKVLEREDREAELETARFFLCEMKNKERQPQTPNAQSEPHGPTTKP